MRTFVAVVFLAAIAALAPAQDTRPQVWEKVVEPGLLYRMEFDPATPRLIHGLRWSMRSSGMRLRPALAGRKVFSNDDKAGKDTLLNTLKDQRAVAGINASFFGATGDPLGFHMVDKEIISLPINPRTAFAWGEKDSTAASYQFRGSAISGEETLSVDGVNQLPGDNQLIVFSSASGWAMSNNKADAVHVVLQAPERLMVNKPVVGRVKILQADGQSRPVEDGELVLTATGAKGQRLAAMRPGQTVKVQVNVLNMDVDRYPNAIGCGNLLVEDRQPAVRWQQEQFQSAFAEQRHPRTALGMTADGDVWLLVVDGRQGMSAGCTLKEMADQMIRLGCTTAINLDGGGSSTIGVGGVVLNRPSDGTERRVADFVMLFADSPRDQAPNNGYWIEGPENLAVGQTGRVRLRDKDGRAIPHSSVLWSAMGGAWVDQGGRITALTGGICKVAAWVDGRRVEFQFMVDGPDNNEPGTGNEPPQL